ncbi:MAG: FAD-dependent oxidoreductase [Caulobacteraceae bacterium]|nr:FAD-dependent oxidoreductase [Caulobacteraceae bacterium]
MTVHVIGAGLAGLAAGVALAKAGVAVEVSEAAAQAGGRCRSYFDSQLGAVIDNGNHLVMSGNQAVRDYLRLIGAGDRLKGPDAAEFDFVDLPTGARWRVRPNASALPLWILAPGRRVPGTVAGDYLALAKLLRAKDDARVDQAVRAEGLLWTRLVEPLLLAALNTAPREGSARLAAAIVRETLGRGGRACMPRIAAPTLAAAFVDPAVAFIQAHGGTVRTGRRLKSMDFSEGRVSTLAFADGETPVAETDKVVLATPPWAAKDLVPGLVAPDDFRAIVNGHFLIAPPPGLPAMLGVIGATVEWIFCFEDRISITISGADRLADADRAALAETLWAEVARALGLTVPLPPWRIVKEKRATFAATVEQDRLRPPAHTAWDNLVLAGDWTQTGLPATIEGALRSGFTAARLASRGEPR